MEQRRQGDKLQWIRVVVVVFFLPVVELVNQPHKRNVVHLWGSLVVGEGGGEDKCSFLAIGFWPHLPPPHNHQPTHPHYNWPTLESSVQFSFCCIEYDMNRLVPVFIRCAFNGNRNDASRREPSWQYFSQRYCIIDITAMAMLFTQKSMRLTQLNAIQCIETGRGQREAPKLLVLVMIQCVTWKEVDCVGVSSRRQLIYPTPRRPRGPRWSHWSHNTQSSPWQWSWRVLLELVNMSLTHTAVEGANKIGVYRPYIPEMMISIGRRSEMVLPKERSKLERNSLFA